MKLNIKWMSPNDPKDAGKAATLGDVARAAGVSRVAASYALRNRPGVSEETRRKIQKVADRLGYRPDARMATKMEKIRDAKERESVPIAWLNTGFSADVWHRLEYLKPYHEGARARCEAMGYKLDEFWLREKGMTSERLSRIIHNRGIRGVIVTPSDRLGHIHVPLKWEWFACVSFEKAIHSPSLVQVAQDRYRNMLLCLKKVRRLGFKRVAILIEQQSDRRSSNAFQAAAMYFFSRVKKTTLLPLLFSGPSATGIPPDFAAWLKQHRPDVVIGQNNHLVEAVEAAGYAVPRDISVVHLALDGDCADWAGVSARKYDIGVATAEAVISLVQNHQYGLPSVARDILVQGNWQMGRTLVLR
ncbi:MAG: LacI family DNA-binding transcriptional regulator [Opitutaceae bacterium]|jgi:LacI family transcriptional regulator